MARHLIPGSTKQRIGALITLLLLAACDKSATELEPIVGRIELSQTIVTLHVFEQVAVVADVFDTSGGRMSGIGVSWRSSDDAVVTVGFDDGVLEALAPGEATITATAQGVAASLWVTVRVGTIGFEVLPDGSTTCDRCAASDEFAPWGILLSFYTDEDLEADSTLTIVRTGARHPGDDADNHMVVGAAGPGGGTWAGVMVVSFVTAADSVRFQLEGNDSVGDFPVRAYGSTGQLLPQDAVRIEDSVVHTLNSGFDSRRDRFKITALEGISRIELDGRNKSTGSARGGFALLLDDLTQWPDP